MSYFRRNLTPIRFKNKKEIRKSAIPATVQYSTRELNIPNKKKRKEKEQG